MQQGGSNHHHELFISLSSGPTHHRSKSRGQHPTKTHRGPFFILYWKQRIHLHHSGGCDRRKVQAIKNLCLLMPPRTGRDLAAAFAHSHEFVYKKCVMCCGRRKRERRRRRGCRGLNAASPHLDSIRRVTAPAHVHEFCKQPQQKLHKFIPNRKCELIFTSCLICTCVMDT
jgi:hypothetical protein